ncbi:MAG: adenylate/guanylate cyclase domain-containing protein [Pseudomonadota bacterium]
MRRLTRRNLRLVSGLVLMAFVTSHFLNHAFGLISLDALNDAKLVFGVWHSPLGSVVILVALLVHIGLTLQSLWSRRTVDMPLWQWGQLALGLMIPGLLALHYAGTRGLQQLFPETQVGYALELYLIWPGSFLQMSLLLLIVWIHGCIGMHFYCRLQTWYRGVAPYALAFAVALPCFSLLGVMSAGRAQREFIEDNPDAFTALQDAQNWPPFSAYGPIYLAETIIVWTFLGIVCLLILGRFLRYLVKERRNTVRIQYASGARVRGPKGSTVLEISRMAGIPHASVCGGRGRCSTCRIEVVEGLHTLPAATPAEARVLSRVGAKDGVRLACQVRPTESLTVAPLLPAEIGAASVRRQRNVAQGTERELVVLFADLRGFTQMSEGRLPYDVVFILNRYFQSMGEAIETAGGRIDKFIGDGIMALFGIDAPPEIAARQSLEAARAMSLALDHLNSDLKAELREPMRIGIGLHIGPAIVGEMGFGKASGLTAIGDMVNVSSRLEAMTKEYGAEVIVSEPLLERAAHGLEAGRGETVIVRGRRSELAIRVYDKGTDIPALPQPAVAFGLRAAGIAEG